MDDTSPDHPTPDAEPVAPARLFGLPHPRGWQVLRGYWSRVDAVTDQRSRVLLVGMLVLPLGGAAVAGVLAGAVVAVGCLGVCVDAVGDRPLGFALWMAGVVAAASWWAAAAWAVGQSRWSKRAFLLVVVLGAALFTLSARGL